MRSWFHLDRIAADGDGNVYLSSEQEIVVLTPGHTLAVWENIHFQKLLKNAGRQEVATITGLEIISCSCIVMRMKRWSV